MNIFCKHLAKKGNTELDLLVCVGIMKLDDLKHVFKSSNLGPVDTRGYIVNLLNKFEVALTWDNRTLLIPSLLPAEDDVHTAAVKVKVRLQIARVNEMGPRPHDKFKRYIPGKFCGCQNRNYVSFFVAIMQN